MFFFNKSKKTKTKKKTTSKAKKTVAKAKPMAKTKAIAIKKYTNNSEKPNKDYNSIDVEWLEKKLQASNKNRVQMLTSDHQEATVKFIKDLLRSDKR